MAGHSNFALISILGFTFFAVLSISTTDNETYKKILTALLTIMIVLILHHIYEFAKPKVSTEKRSKTKLVNFNAFDKNSELQPTSQVYQNPQSEINNQPLEKQERPQFKEIAKKSDKEARKNNMKNYFQVEQEFSEKNLQDRNAANRMYYGDDSRSLYSQQAFSAPYIQSQALFGRSCYYGDIQQKSKGTEALLSKMVKKMGDAHIKAEELIFKSFLPIFVNEFQDHLINVNRMMKEHFQQKVIEIDIFFANKPYDVNSNRHEKSIGLKSITMNDVFFLKNQIKTRQREPVRAPTAVDKFTRDKPEFIKECDLLELFSDILDLSLLNRNLLSDRKTLLLKLVDFCDNNVKPTYQSEGLQEKIASDYELLFTVFINTIIQCVKYEKQKYVKEISGTSLNLLKSIDVSIITLDSFGLNQQSSDQPSRNIIIQQKLEYLNQEPQFHYYSDYIVKQLTKDKEQKTLKLNEFILYTSRDQNSINGLVCYYLLHLLCLPKQNWQQLQQLEMDQKMIKCLIRMAKDLSYLVTNI